MITCNAHSMFAMNEMFWECLVCWALLIVHITKVFKVTKDLEHNNYAHVQQAHHVITMAIVCYLMQDVVAPRPSLLLRSPELYLQQVESATGIVLVRYLQHAGFPILQWQRAAREGDGLKLKKLFAYSHHLFRSVSHKPVWLRTDLAHRSPQLLLCPPGIANRALGYSEPLSAWSAWGDISYIIYHKRHVAIISYMSTLGRGLRPLMVSKMPSTPKTTTTCSSGHCGGSTSSSSRGWAQPIPLSTRIRRC